jgi:hypothetical protein
VRAAHDAGSAHITAIPKALIALARRVRAFGNSAAWRQARQSGATAHQSILLCKRACTADDAWQMSQKRHAHVAFHADVQWINGARTLQRGRTMAGPLDFASYKRPQSSAESNNGQMPGENLGDLLGQVAENSTGGINDLIGDFERLREKLRTDGERIQRDVAEYRTLSEQVMQLTKTVSENVDKVRGSADR